MPAELTESQQQDQRDESYVVILRRPADQDVVCIEERELDQQSEVEMSDRDAEPGAEELEGPGQEAPQVTAHVVICQEVGVLRERAIQQVYLVKCY